MFFKFYIRKSILCLFSASFYIFINCVGVKPMPFLYVAEVLPDNVSRMKELSFQLIYLLILGA